MQTQQAKDDSKHGYNKNYRPNFFYLIFSSRLQAHEHTTQKNTIITNDKAE